MNRIFLKRFSVFNFPWWKLKVFFYILYLIFIQIANSDGKIEVNIMVGMVMISIIEVSKYCLRLLFSDKRYIKAVSIASVNYIMLALIGYYILHRSDNSFSAQIWDKNMEFSWDMFLWNFSKFYLTFVKYAIILTLLKRVLFFVRKKVKDGETAAVSDMGGQQTDIQSSEHPDQYEYFSDGHRTIKFKAGKGMYILDIFTVVFLEVKDEITTIYRVSGAPLEVKVPLSKFREWLPEDKFFQIHKSRIIAIHFFLRETNGHIYLSPYEDKPLKLGDQKRYPQYKTWKENNLSKDIMIQKKGFQTGRMKTFS